MTAGGNLAGAGTVAAAAVDDGGAKRDAHTAFGRGGAVVVAGVEHGDDGDGAGAIETGPLAVDQRVLHVVPVFGSLRQGELAVISRQHARREIEDLRVDGLAGVKLDPRFGALAPVVQMGEWDIRWTAPVRVEGDRPRTGEGGDGAVRGEVGATRAPDRADDRLPKDDEAAFVRSKPDGQAGERAVASVVWQRARRAGAVALIGCGAVVGAAAVHLEPAVGLLVSAVIVLVVAVWGQVVTGGPVPQVVAEA